MGKRLIVIAIAIAMVGGAYAAGAVTHSGVLSLSGHRLRSLDAMRQTDPQSFTIHGTDRPATPVPGATLVLRVRPGEQGIFDIRFQPAATTSHFIGDIVIDGVAIPPLAQSMFGSCCDPIGATERVAGPLPAGRHVVTVVAQAPLSGVTWDITLPGFTLVAEGAASRP